MAENKRTDDKQQLRLKILTGFAGFIFILLVIIFIALFIIGTIGELVSHNFGQFLLFVLSAVLIPLLTFFAWRFRRKGKHHESNRFFNILLIIIIFTSPVLLLYLVFGILFLIGSPFVYWY